RDFGRACRRWSFRKRLAGRSACSAEIILNFLYLYIYRYRAAMSDNEKEFVVKESRSRSVSPRGSVKSNSNSPGRSKDGSHRSRSRSKSRSRSRSKSRSRSRSHRSSRRRHSRSRSRRRHSRSRSYSREYRRSRSHSPMSNRRRHVGNRANPAPNCCLGVFGLSLYTTERDLREVFSKYGPLANVNIVYDQQSRRSRGFAFVYFENSEDSKEAKEQANGMELDGRRIRVDFSITKRPHTPTPGIYMGRPTYGGGGGRPSTSSRSTTNPTGAGLLHHITVVEDTDPGPARGPTPHGATEELLYLIDGGDCVLVDEE
ncbi:hypothetical protein PHYPO_G00153550, partial [Pangasianodon hypophthalmus]